MKKKYKIENFLVFKISIINGKDKAYSIRITEFFSAPEGFKKLIGRAMHEYKHVDIKKLNILFIFKKIDLD